MKTFKFPQNKWVMTATLAAVLGLNVSINYQPSQIETAEFASTAGAVIESEVLTADGPLSVRYLNNEKDKSEVLAIIPKKNTEGKVCVDCFQTITLQTTNKEDIKALNSQLQQVLRDKEAAAAKVATAPAKPAVEPEESVPVKKDPFAAIERKCKKHKENADLLKCTSEEFTSLLRKKGGAEVDEQEALDFFRSKIATSIQTETEKARSLLITERENYINSNVFDILSESEKINGLTSVSIRAMYMREETLKAIRQIIAETPSKYEEVRKRLIDTQSEIAREDVLDFQQAYLYKREKTVPAYVLFKFEHNKFAELINGIQYHTNAGLNQAASTGDLNADLHRQYQARINSILQQLAAGTPATPTVTTNNNSTFGSTPGVSTSTSTTTIPSNLSIRLANPGRNTNGQTNGTINRAYSGPDLSQRLGNRVQSPAMGIRGRQ